MESVTYPDGWMLEICRSAKLPDTFEIDGVATFDVVRNPDGSYDKMVIRERQPTSVTEPEHELTEEEWAEAERELRTECPNMMWVRYTKPDGTPTFADLACQHDNGLILDIVKWVCNTAPVVDPGMALIVAVSVIGTLVGRKVAGPSLSGTGTHLYALILATTGAGKDHYRKAAGKLLRAAGASHMVGADSFMSESAVYKFLERTPVSLCIQDEFGATLKKINISKNSHEQNVSKVLRSAWGSSFDTLQTPEWAGLDRNCIAIESPALSLLGISTPDEFFDALTSGNLSNGFLNRFFVYLANKGERQEHPPEEFTVPDDLAEKLQYIRTGGYQLATMAENSGIDEDEDEGEKGEGKSKGKIKERPSMRPQPPIMKMQWARGAEELFLAYWKEVEDRITGTAQLEHYIKRCPEMAVRLATDRALSRSSDGWFTRLERSDMEWGIAIVRPAGDQLAAWARERMSHDDHSFGTKMNKLKELISDYQRTHNGEPMPHSELMAKSKYSKKDFDHVRDTLIGGGTIVLDEGKPGKNGVKPKSYRMAVNPT
jgi:hypothetical protein